MQCQTNVHLLHKNPPKEPHIPQRRPKPTAWQHTPLPRLRPLQVQHHESELIFLASLRTEAGRVANASAMFSYTCLKIGKLALDLATLANDPGKNLLRRKPGNERSVDHFLRSINWSLRF